MASYQQPPPQTSPPSPPEKDKEKEKPIYLRVQSRYYYDERIDSQLEWYVIDTSKITSHTESRLYSISKMPYNFPQESGCVVWEHIIYAFGGGDEENPSPEVYFLDTHCPEDGWRKGPSMAAGRSKHHCTVIDGIIYIMGFSDYPHTIDPPLWGETLDPLTNEYKPLSAFPDKHNCVQTHALLNGGKQLLVHPELSNCLYMYDTESEWWTLFDENFGLGHGWLQTPCAVVDDVMYCFEREVIAYDLAKRRWFRDPVKGLDGRGVRPLLWETNGLGSPDPNFPKAFLVHVGNGKLCLIWHEQNGSGLNIHCTKFRVWKQSDGRKEDCLLAIIETFQMFYIDCGDDLVDCFVS